MNHLRAFVRTLLRQTGETYQPQYLSLDVYQAILDGSSPSGGPGGSGQSGSSGRTGGGWGRQSSLP